MKNQNIHQLSYEPGALGHLHNHHEYNLEHQRTIVDQLFDELKTKKSLMQ
jgi:hypothetical protein